MSRILFAAVAVLGASAALAAPEKEVKVDLKSFKWKCNFDGGTELGGYDENENRFFLYTFGSATGEVAIPADGEYTITLEASCNQAEKELAKFKLSVGDVVVTKEFTCTTEDAKKYSFTTKLKKGKHPFAIEFLNDAFKEGEFDRNLYVHSIKVEKAEAKKGETKKDPEKK